MTDLTTGNIYRNFIGFGLPMVLSGLLSQAYSIVDTAIAGKFLGEAGLAAVGATAQIISLACGFFWGFHSGLSIHIACLFGSHEYKKLKKDIFNILAVLIGIEFIFGLLIVLLADPIIEFIKVDPAIRVEAKKYFCIYVVGLFLIVTNNAFSKLLNALGISGFPFYMSVVSGALNVAGNILSVTVFDFGVAGIAASSVLAAGVVDVLYIFKLKSCYKTLGVDREKSGFSFRPFASVLKFALPTSLQQISMYFAGAAMSPIINGLGSDATAGYTVVSRIYDINAGVYQNSSIVLSNYGAQCAGAKKYDKIKKGLFVGLLQGVLFVLPFILVCSILAVPVNSFFFPSGFSGRALDYAVLFSRVFLPFILFNLINNLFHSFFRGIGAMGLLLASTLIGSVVRIAVGVILGLLYGMTGIYLGMAVSWIAEALFMLIIYLIKFKTTEKIQSAAEKNFAD